MIEFARGRLRAANVSHCQLRPSCMTGPGMSSTPSISSTSFSRSAGLHAIAHHGRGDAMPGGRGHVAVPDRLAVVMGVDVDEARRDDATPGIDFLRATTLEPADGGDPVATHRDIAAAADLSIVATP